jgi:hypothetical protein
LKLIFFKAFFHRVQLEVVGCWRGNLWPSECPGVMVKHSLSIVRPLHKTIHEVWTICLYMQNTLSAVRSWPL